MKIKFLSLIAVISISGCATISGNGSQDVLFDTKQEGIKLYSYNDKYLCDLPCVREMDGNSARFFVAKGDGYKSKMVSVDISRSKASYADIFISAKLVNGLSGADVNLEGYVFVELEENDEDSL